LRVLADALEQPVAHPTVVVVIGDDERLVDELAHRSTTSMTSRSSPASTAFGCGEITSAGEDRQPVQRAPFRRFEQVVGPVDRAPQGLMTLERGAAASREELEPLVETSNKILRRQ